MAVRTPIPRVGFKANDYLIKGTEGAANFQIVAYSSGATSSTIIEQPLMNEFNAPKVFDYDPVTSSYTVKAGRGGTYLLGGNWTAGGFEGGNTSSNLFLITPTNPPAIGTIANSAYTVIAQAGRSSNSGLGSMFDGEITLTDGQIVQVSSVQAGNTVNSTNTRRIHSLSLYFVPVG